MMQYGPQYGELCYVTLSFVTDLNYNCIQVQ
jgi:hypothetical protein